VLGTKYFKRVLEKAGLSSTIRLYDLRHTCATLLLLAGENPKVVAERLGHSSVMMTLDVYSHVLPSMQMAATKKLEGLLSGSRKHLANNLINTKGSEDIVNPPTLANKYNNKSWEAGIRTPIGGSRVRNIRLSLFVLLCISFIFSF